MLLTEKLKRTSVSLIPAACLVASSIAPAALAASPFQALIGTWSGSGQIRYEDGQAEGIRCTAYYSERGQSLRLAIRCRGASNDVEIRGLLASRGDRLSGTWEERTFNVAGEATGRMSRGRMNLSIAGGAVSGAMSITYGSGRQTVVITVQGVALRSVNITLRRN